MGEVFERNLRRLIVGVFAAAFFAYVIVTWNWMVLCDSAIMHYVNFLMAHGMKPYSQITDNNLPGSYMSEWLAMHVFGAGDYGWRVYEYFLALVLTAGLVVIALPYDWVAGVFAGGMFVMLHGKEGSWWTIEREQVMTVILVLGYAAMFTAVRRQRPAWMLAMGFCTAFAASIKPTFAPLALVLLVFAGLVLRRRGQPWVSAMLYGLCGMAAATALNVGFLLEHHAWHDFIVTQRVITTYYVALSHVAFPEMVIKLLPPFDALLALGALALAVANRRWTWEQWALALGAGVGLLSYFLQHKGYYAHRYLFVVLLLLLAGMELMRALRMRGWRQWVSAGLIAATIVVFVPYSLRATWKVKGTSDFAWTLQSDLEQLGGSGPQGGTDRLQGQVQCLDLVWGCIDALYRLRLVENTGFTGDMIVFDAADSPARRDARAQWWRAEQEHPAEVLVLSNEYFQGTNTFDKVANWPEYQRYMNAHYTLVVTRGFPDEFGPRYWTTDPRELHAYKLYIRNGSPLLQVKLAPPGKNELTGQV